MAGKCAREWYPPEGAEPVEDGGRLSLRLYNSLLDEKVPFVPTGGPGSKQVSWYTCGPTVYDIAHVGHARCVDGGLMGRGHARVVGES